MPFKRKILIVDDVEINRRVLCKILSTEYNTLSAENGQIALEILQQHAEEISLILLDVVMPVMDGYELLKRLQNTPNLSGIPVIIATQQDSVQAEIKALSAGATDFITKPYNAQVIRHRVSAIIKLRENSAIINAIRYDRLTGVYGSDYFYQQAQWMIANNPSKQYDIICSDIENFKLVNDLFGIKTGDEVLCHIAHTLEDFVEGCGICGRITSDIFAVLMERNDCYTDDMFYNLDRKINAFPIHYNLTLKYGVYLVEDRTISVSTMCDRALLAIDTIKNKYGKEFAFYDKTLREKLLSEQLILENMESAISEHQFQVYLQPKYNIRNRKIAGAEALVRWIHPQHGFMSPGEFIPLFEKNGFITQLDYYVWQETCRIMEEWQTAGFSAIPVSVNVSRADIYNVDLPEIFLNLTKSYHIDPKQLHLEITESAYTENPQQIIETVSQLRSLGFIIEMDDFGTGYSSLSMLSELPIDVLKLDMQFIQTEMKKNKSRSILSFISSLAKWMDLVLIAEGVETQEQIDRLMNMDCIYVQGYFFSKPLPLTDFNQLLASSECEDFMIVVDSSLVSNTTLEISETRQGIMLIVDDYEMHRSILKETFSKYFMIAEANNGLSAFEYAMEHSAELDIILLDLMMPIMDGFQFLERIKKDPGLSHIPVVVTAEGTIENQVKALRLGASDYICKPYHPEILLHHVECAIALSTYEQRALQFQKQEALLNEVYTDPLTELLNRRGMQKFLFDLRKAYPNSSHGLFMIDVDNLKQCNDSQGHLFADEILKDFAHALKHAVRSDDIVARFGGDEFVLILKDLNSTEIALRKGEAICKSIRELQNERNFSVSCSIGVTIMQSADTLQEAIERADKALYWVKRNAKGHCHIWNESLA